MYWLDVFSWSFRGLAQNEFLAPRYAVPLGASGTTLGHAFLDTFGISTDERFRWAALGFPLVCLAIVVSVGIVIFDRIRIDRNIGSHRDVVSGAVDGAAVVGAVGGAAAAASSESTFDGAHVAVAVAAGGGGSSGSGNGGGGAEGVASALPFTPITVVFRDIHYAVDLPRRQGGGTRVLLQGTAGCARPWRLMALMGASGERAGDGGRLISSHPLSSAECYAVYRAELVRRLGEDNTARRHFRPKDGRPRSRDRAAEWRIRGRQHVQPRVLLCRAGARSTTHVQCHAGALAIREAARRRRRFR